MLLRVKQGCILRRNATIYTKVLHVIDWIQNTLQDAGKLDNEGNRTKVNVKRENEVSNRTNLIFNSDGFEPISSRIYLGRAFHNLLAV